MGWDGVFCYFLRKQFVIMWFGGFFGIKWRLLRQKGRSFELPGDFFECPGRSFELPGLCFEVPGDCFVIWGGGFRRPVTGFVEKQVAFRGPQG